MLTGPLEPTNEPYAIAKIAGIKMAEAYRSDVGYVVVEAVRTTPGVLDMWGGGGSAALLRQETRDGEGRSGVIGSQANPAARALAGLQSRKATHYSSRVAVDNREFRPGIEEERRGYPCF
ncbi:hypothetical protein XI06_12550 [Bradyrhizobium sp. CCBAU 11434]|nr:hypothetical protein [Bradyrhizobium sp. CCBAU 11434]